MTIASESALADPALALETVVDDRTRQILERRRSTMVKRRGWLVRRLLLIADIVGLTISFVIAQHLARVSSGGLDHLSPVWEMTLFVLTLPVWVIVAKLYGLYDHDEERTHHGATDDFAGIFHLVTVGVWLFYVLAYLTDIAHPNLAKMIAFWAFAIAAVGLARIVARTAFSTVQPAGSAAPAERVTFARFDIRPDGEVLPCPTLGTHLDLFQRIVISTCSVSAVAYAAGGPVVLTVNSTGGSLAELRPS